MLKVSFKDDFKKVETFNGKATVVILTGECITPLWFSNVPHKIWEWAMWHPSVEISETYSNQNLMMIMKVSGKSICVDDDTFDAKMGERIAECRAKIRIYKFMQTLTKMLYKYYKGIVFGKNVAFYDTDICSRDSILYTNTKYTELLEHERHHLNKLLQKTV